MDSYDYGTPEPNLKFEPSPTESFMSTPGGEYPSLFANSPMPSTMNPRDFMTPESTHADDFHNDTSSQSAGDRNAPSETPEPGAGDKKQTKKRKSWGQVLPEPKTNLPPRKRAKTEDEKEQRRVERVLRNRRAAQSSRERKRQEVEALEKKNQELVDKLDRANRLIEELCQKLGSSSSASTSLDALRPNPITFSQELFNSQDGHMAPQQPTTASSLMDGITLTDPDNTLDPASLSPTLCTVPEEEEEEEEDWLVQNESSTPTAAAAASAPKAAVATSEETSPDSTQLPAAKLCLPDLQCRSAEAPPRSWPTATSSAATQPQLFLFLTLYFQTLLSTISACRQPLLQVAMSMRAGFSLPPTPVILSTIIWLVTTPRRSARPTTPKATSTTTSTLPSSLPTISLLSSSSSSSHSPTTATPAPTTPASPRSPTLRLRSLRRILSCSPHLARPLRDATLEVLRLVVSKKNCDDVDMVDGVTDWSTTKDAVVDCDKSRPRQQQRLFEVSDYLENLPAGHEGRLPSVEVLFALAWFCEVEVEKSEQREHISFVLPRVTSSTALDLKMAGRDAWDMGRRYNLGPKQVMD